ncbi:MAG: hypothetical protein M0P47_03440 [Bacteroidales bacterium]|nr:hypothetical protein [Bacteroidales bacterium]
MRDVPVETLVYAVHGAGEEVAFKVEKNLGVRALRQYKELIKKLKKLKPSEVTKNRRQIIQELNKNNK